MHTRPSLSCALRTRGRRGVSMIELVVTILIIGILAAAASPQFAGAMIHYQAEATAARIAADLNYARRTAVNSSTDTTVQFMASPGAYQMTGVQHPHHPAQSYAVTLSDLSDTATFASVSFDGNMDITFNTYGLPQTGSPLSPLSDGTIVVAVGSEQRTVTVDSSTGKAAVQ